MKRLVPLGFTRSDIRKELYLSQGEPERDHLDGGGDGSSASTSLVGGMVTAEGEGQEVEKQAEKEGGAGKAFAIQCMQVSQCTAEYFFVVVKIDITPPTYTHTFFSNQCMMCPSFTCPSLCR